MSAGNYQPATVINLSTGQITQVALTPGEVAQRDAERAASEAANAQNDTDAATLRNKVVPIIQSAVGVSIDNLTAAQRNGLIVALLWNAGALNPDGTIKPLGQWINK